MTVESEETSLQNLVDAIRWGNLKLVKLLLEENFPNCLDHTCTFYIYLMKRSSRISTADSEEFMDQVHF